MSHVAPVPHMSHVDFKKAHAMSLIFICMSLGYMSHVEFKKKCRVVVSDLSIKGHSLV